MKRPIALWSNVDQLLNWVLGCFLFIFGDVVLIKGLRYRT